MSISLKLFNKKIPHSSLCVYANVLVNPEINYNHLKSITGFPIQEISRALARLEQMRLIKLERGEKLYARALPLPDWLVDDAVLNKALEKLTGIRKGLTTTRGRE